MADTSLAMEVTLASPETFTVTSETEIKGHIASDHSFLLRDMRDSGVELYVTCSSDAHDQQSGAVARKGGLLPCTLDIAIYGPFAMLQELGEWSEHNEV